MPVISCYNCRKSNPSHFVGSYDEYRYYSVSNHSREAVNGKIFFCCESCYLDSVFIDAILSEASKNHDLPDDVRPTYNDIVGSTILGPIADELRPHYDDIVSPMYNEYSWNKYHARQAEFRKNTKKKE